MKVRTTKTEILETVALIELREKLVEVARAMLVGQQVDGMLELTGIESRFMVDFEARKRSLNTLEMQAKKRIAELWASAVPGLIEQSLKIIDEIGPFEIEENDDQS